MVNEMRDAVRDDAGLAAARAGQDQQRTFDVRNGFALLGIQAFKKIHQVSGSGELFYFSKCEKPFR